MKRLKLPELNSGYASGCTMKKRSGVKKITSRDSAALANKEKVVDNKDSEPSSRHFSREGGTPVGILFAGGVSSEEGGRRSMTCASHGLISIIGRRRVMEDAVTVSIGETDSYDLFAVYDGHGGTHASNVCRERLHLLIAKEVEEKGRLVGGGGDRRLKYWEDVMTACFTKMDEEVSRRGDGDVEDEVESVGSTAVVVMVGNDELVVANCGDARAVLCRGGVAVPLSRDHKVT